MHISKFSLRSTVKMLDFYFVFNVSILKCPYRYTQRKMYCKSTTVECVTGCIQSFLATLPTDWPRDIHDMIDLNINGNNHGTMSINLRWRGVDCQILCLCCYSVEITLAVKVQLAWGGCNSQVPFSWHFMVSAILFYGCILTTWFGCMSKVNSDTSEQ